MTTARRTEQGDFAQPDEVRAFPLGHAEILTIGGADIGRLVFQPGRRWSEHVEPIAGTELPEAPHFRYHLAGTQRFRTVDGSELDATPGQITPLPAGHDACVVGNGGVVVLDRFGAGEDAR